MFSDAALSEALGQPLTQPEYPAEWAPALEPESQLVAHAGGMRCDWAEPPSTPDVFTTPVLLVVAVPAGAVSVPEDTVCVETDISATGCPIDVIANGIRLSGLLTSDLDGADRAARVAAVEALFTASASATSAGTLPGPEPGAWPAQDCAAIASSLSGAAASFTSDDSMGTDAYASVVEVDLRGGRRLYPCSLVSDSVSLNFSVLGGGAWVRDDVLALEGATVVDVPGLDLVVERGVGDIDVFDGVNWLRAYATGPDRHATVKSIVEALDDQA